MASKAVCQRIHAKRRASQRYGMKFNKDDLRNIVKIIQNGDATVLKKQSERVRILQLTYKDQEFKVVYDKNRKNIVTFLPLE